MKQELALKSQNRNWNQVWFCLIQWYFDYWLVTWQPFNHWAIRCLTGKHHQKSMEQSFCIWGPWVLCHWLTLILAFFGFFFPHQCSEVIIYYTWGPMWSRWGSELGSVISYAWEYPIYHLSGPLAFSSTLTVASFLLSKENVLLSWAVSTHKPTTELWLGVDRTAGRALALHAARFDGQNPIWCLQVLQVWHKNHTFFSEAVQASLPTLCQFGGFPNLAM